MVINSRLFLKNILLSCEYLAIYSKVGILRYIKIPVDGFIFPT